MGSISALLRAEAELCLPLLVTFLGAGENSSYFSFGTGATLHTLLLEHYLLAPCC